METNSTRAKASTESTIARDDLPQLTKTSPEATNGRDPSSNEPFDRGFAIERGTQNDESPERQGLAGLRGRSPFPRAPRSRFCCPC